MSDSRETATGGEDEEGPISKEPTTEEDDKRRRADLIARLEKKEEELRKEKKPEEADAIRKIMEDLQNLCQSLEESNQKRKDLQRKWEEADTKIKFLKLKIFVLNFLYQWKEIRAMLKRKGLLVHCRLEDHFGY